MNNNPNAPVLTPAERAAALAYQAQFLAQISAGGQPQPVPGGGIQPAPGGGGGGQPAPGHPHALGVQPVPGVQPAPGGVQPVHGGVQPAHGGGIQLAPGVGAQPAPGVQPVPGVVQPAPGGVQPVPGAGAPAPGVGAQPAPGAQPVPGAVQPAPGGVQPVPGVGAPAPQVQQPGQWAIVIGLLQQLIAQQQPPAQLPPLIQPALVPPVPIVQQQAVPPVGQPVVAPASVFPLCPGRSGNNLPLDFALPADTKLFKSGIEPLDDKFDLQSSGINHFLYRVMDRCVSYYWDDGFNIPDIHGITPSLFTEYGTLTKADCRRHAETYCHTPTRLAQNSFMSHQFILGSLTKEARDEIFACYPEYMIPALPPDNYDIGLGACLLKTIIGKSVVDTLATEGTLRNALSNLPNKLVELQSNIKMFNLYVVQQRFGLTARGVSVPELLNQLFNAYRNASEARFVQAINSQHAAYISGAPMDSDTRMTTALTLYEFYVDDKTWTPPAKASKKVIAMQAKHDKLKDGSSGEVVTPQKKPKRDDTWKKEKPKNNEKTKIMNGRTFNWCKWHKAWVIHDPAACLLQTKKKTPTTNENQQEDKPPLTKPKSLRFDPALKATIEDESDEEDY
jgi:hypothetical protein